LIKTKSNHFLLDKLKQYLEQLRKECSDRMVDRVIDPETDKPSKVNENIFSYKNNLNIIRNCSGGFVLFVVVLWIKVY
jgi:hypothetical protein